MSMCSTFVRCHDGKFYKNLIYWGKDRSWFVCFDDRDPVELVVKQAADLDPKKILDDLGIPYIEIKRPKRMGRLFGKAFKFEEAVCCFMRVSDKPFPSPRDSDEYDEVFAKHPAREGVYYGVEMGGFRR